MPKKMLFLMDPIENINIKKDSTFAVMLAAQKAGHVIYYAEKQHLFLRDGHAYASLCEMEVMKNQTSWFRYKQAAYEMRLTDMDIIWMRIDPPFNASYLYTTHLLSLAERQGVRVINRPSSLRDCNEKLFAQWFPELCPPTLVSGNIERLKSFLKEQDRIILKPLDGMGGQGIFYLDQSDKNKNVILETMTHHGETLIMAQRFLEDIAQGDKRITLINGEPIDYVVARIPAADDVRGNLASGGKAHVLPLSEKERALCMKIGPSLREKGLYWVGLDVIGDFITEINVTSPTCLCEIEDATGLCIAETVLEHLGENACASFTT